MLDLKEEQKYDQLRKLAQELHIPMPEAFWELEVTDKDGKVIQTLKQRSHSWTRNAYNHLVSQLMAINIADAVYGAGNINIKTTAAVVLSGVYTVAIADLGMSVEALGKGYRGDAGMDTSGIVVGSNAAVENFEDIILGTKILNGVAAGQLSYIGGDAPVKSYVAGTKVYSVDWVRYFNNNSGGNVLVKEVGIYAAGYTVSPIKYWLQSRDKLVATITVPTTGQLKVTYTTQITYAG